jgi:hypothetical protein
VIGIYPRFLGQLGHDRGRRSGDEEEPVELAFAHHIGGLAGSDRKQVHVLRPQAMGLEDQKGIHLGARALAVDRKSLAAQLLDAAQEDVVPNDEVQGLREEVRDGANAGDGAALLEGPGPGIGPVSHVGLAQTGLELARGNRLDIGHGAMRRNRSGDQAGHPAAAAALAFAAARRVADRAGDQATDRKIGSASRACAYSEEREFAGMAAAERSEQDESENRSGRSRPTPGTFPSGRPAAPCLAHRVLPVARAGLPQDSALS